jgi:hypothetical protein
MPSGEGGALNPHIGASTPKSHLAFLGRRESLLGHIVPARDSCACLAGYGWRLI